MSDPPEHQRVTQSASMQSLRELVSLAAHVGPAVAKRAQLSHSELDALEVLMEHDLGPVELSRRLGVTSAAASGIVDRLEARGHVNREPHHLDGRRVSVVMTESARREVIGHLMPMFSALSELDNRLTGAERAVIDRFLREAIAAIRRLL
ncbi:MAG: MarR family winged helix-turn-helix transcriptional regulator [Nocardioides sp.]